MTDLWAGFARAQASTNPARMLRVAAGTSLLQSTVLGGLHSSVYSVEHWQGGTDLGGGVWSEGGGAGGGEVGYVKGYESRVGYVEDEAVGGVAGGVIGSCGSSTVVDDVE